MFSSNSLNRLSTFPEKEDKSNHTNEQKNTHLLPTVPGHFAIERRKKDEYFNNLVFIRLGKKEAARILKAAKIGEKTLKELKKAGVYKPQSDKQPKIEIPIDLNIHFHSSAILKKLGVYSDPDIDWIQYPEDFPIESIENDPSILKSKIADANTYKDDIRIKWLGTPENFPLKKNKTTT